MRDASQSILTAAISRRMLVYCYCGKRSASLVCAGGSPMRCRDRRDPRRICHDMFEMAMARVSAIACGHKDAIDLDRLRHDPLLKLAVGRCPDSGAPLASQSTISRLENAPSKTGRARGKTRCRRAAQWREFAVTASASRLNFLHPATKPERGLDFLQSDP